MNFISKPLVTWFYWLPHGSSLKCTLILILKCPKESLKLTTFLYYRLFYSRDIMELIALLYFGPWRYHCKPKAPDEILSAHWMNVTWGSRGLHELTHVHWKHIKSSIVLHGIYWQPLASDSLNSLLITRFWQTKWKLPRLKSHVSHFRTKESTIKIEQRFRWL